MYLCFFVLNFWWEKGCEHPTRFEQELYAFTWASGWFIAACLAYSAKAVYKGIMAYVAANSVQVIIYK